jgi:hypothetical protein
VGKLLFGVSLLALTCGLGAQTAVTGITYGTLVDNANQTNGGITYLNRDREVHTVSTTSLGDYHFTGPLATNVFFRRNTDSNGNGTPNQSSDNPNNSTLIYQVNGSNQAYGDYNANLASVFLDGNLYTGIRNPFANGAGTATNSNIERIDFYFAGGYTVQANDALVFFDVENTGNFGDGFRIAAFTSVGTVNGVTNAPTAYANTGLLVAADSFGGPINNPEGGSTGTYYRSTFTNGDNLSGTASGTTSAGTLQLVGILISFADLGISAGTTIYGYSLMAGDVAPTTAANLVNWNNTTYYPVNTDPAGYGNMDFPDRPPSPRTLHLRRDPARPDRDLFRLASPPPCGFIISPMSLRGGTRPSHPGRLCTPNRLLLLALLAAATRLPAQLAVTEITTSTTDLSDQTVNGVVFERTTTSITTFKDAAGNIYDANTIAGNAYIRRNTGAGNANNSSVWYTQDTTNPARFDATYATDYATLLLGNNILRGTDNTFANGTGTSTGNIERIDFLFSATGITASAATSFAIFDRGAVGQHDYVKIAVITGWDSTNNVPTAYGGVLASVTTADYGSANVTANFTYNLFRYSNGNNLGSPYWSSNSETGTQGIGGVVLSMADLGISAGTTIYGYSLMAYDVTTGGNMANLVDWNNATYYPTNTNGDTGSGGIDLSAVNGVLYNRRVPEPSTYGALLLGLGGAFFGWRRYRRRLNAAAA